MIDQPSEKKFPIAVVDLKGTNAEMREWNQKVSELIRNDLEMMGMFDLIPSDQFPTEPAALSTTPSTISFPPWTLIGAMAVVNGSYEKTADGLRVELHLYDPVLGQRLMGQSYTSKGKDMSVIAHDFADRIVESLTGEEGVFSTQIAYVQASKHTKEIGIMGMNGDNPRVITKDRTTALSPTWSPNGSEIAYTTLTKAGSAEINIIPATGGQPKRVTTNGQVNVSPTWAPSGALTVASSTTGDTNLYLINRAGGVIRRLTNSFGIDVNPSWAPGGGSFVFASERAGKLHLFKADSSGGSVERLTFVGSQNDNPAWSPKGDKIVFQSLDGGWDLFIMNANGSGIQRLTSDGNCESPSWAPNSRFIAFTKGTQVHLMREDGSNVTAVGPKNSLQPAWGPWVK